MMSFLSNAGLHVFILAGWSLLVLSGCAIAMRCPSVPQCNCTFVPDEETTQVDCRHANLTEIPNVPVNTTVLDLSFNNIMEIEDKLHNLTELQILNVSYNLIERLNNDSFQENSRLRFLSIAHNNMSYTSIESSTFNPIKDLIELHIEQDIQQYGDYPVALNSLTNLQILSISGLPDRILKGGPDGFHVLVNLTLSGISSWCNLTQLDHSSFDNTPNLKHLDISNCTLKSITNDTFSPLHNLTFLDVSDNTGLSFPSFENITFSVRNSSLQVLRMNRITSRNAGCSTISKSMLQHIQHLPLRELYMDGNRLTFVADDANGLFPQTIEILSMEDNTILSRGTILFSFFKQTSNITKIYAAHQFVDHAPPISSNTQEISRHTRNSMTRKGTRKHESDFFLTFVFPRNLEYVDYSDSKFSRRIEGVHNLANNSLKYLNASNNRLQIWNATFFGLNSLATVDISNNFITLLRNECFRYSPLNTLLLNGNLLGDQLEEDENGELFNNHSDMRFLNLSYNTIETLPAKLFQGVPNLQSLDLSHNSIRNVTWRMAQFRNITYLNLRDNKIVSLNAETTQYFDTIGERLKLDLSDNRFICSCDYIEFLEWLITTQVELLGKTSYRCQAESETIYFKGLPRYVEIKKAECANHLLEIVLSSTIGVAFLISSLAGLSYRYRWKLRYLYHVAWQRRSRPHKHCLAAESEEDSLIGDNVFSKDIFLLHADEDFTFVKKHFVENMEQSKGLTLHIPERDFVAFEFITSNIIQAIQSCRKTVVILSNDFLKNKWCMFGMNMAYMEGVYTGRDVLCILMFPGVPTSSMSLEVMSMIRSKRYLEFPDNDEDEIGFWERFIAHIQQ